MHADVHDGPKTGTIKRFYEDTSLRVVSLEALKASSFNDQSFSLKVTNPLPLNVHFRIFLSIRSLVLRRLHD